MQDLGIETDVLLTRFFTMFSFAILGNLRCYNGDSNENVTDKTIGFNEKTKALYVRFEFWYIFFSVLDKRQREMTKFKVWWRT